MNTPILACENIEKSFGGVRALRTVSVTFREGEILGIIGPNGSGKTTLFNIISGHEAPDGGTVSLNGHDVTGKPPHKMAALGLARTFQNLRLFEGMSALENVLGGGHLRAPRGLLEQMLRLPSTAARDRAAREEAQTLLNAVGLGEHARNFATDLSYGQTKRLELARALNTQPRILLLDEPTAGMNDRQAREILELVKDIKERFALTLVVIEHNVPALVWLAERMVALDAGEVVCEGTPEEVVQDPHVIAAYLGTGAEA
ncbi:MAG: ABC transporter ATP-binding protein [Pseudomonadota bacterium]